jgi:hypothetical protein
MVHLVRPDQRLFNLFLPGVTPATPEWKPPRAVTFHRSSLVGFHLSLRRFDLSNEARLSNWEEKYVRSFGTRAGSR